MPDEPPAEEASAEEEEAPKGMVAYPDSTVTAEQYAEKEKAGAPPAPVTEPAGQAPAEPPPVDGEVVHESPQ
jgi:hypothetical protein